MRLSFVLNLLLLLVSSLLHKAWAQVVAPSNGGDVSIVRVTATSMVLNVGQNGNGQGRVVAMAAVPYVMPIALAPNDNQFYKASMTYGQGSSLGKGYVVYNGSDNLITITGLSPDTYYYISSSEYNTDNAVIAYNTRGRSILTATYKAPPTPLPIQLIEFTGSVDTRSLATLKWATASEYNTDYFALERSANGATFVETARKTAMGSSSQEVKYQWADPQRLETTTYYRLRQVDRDGTTTYSGVVTLQPALATPRQVAVYPNPGTSRAIQLSLQGYAGSELTIRLCDAVGRVVAQQVLAPVTDSHLSPISPAAEIAAGTYVITIEGAGSPIRHWITITD